MHKIFKKTILLILIVCLVNLKGNVIAADNTYYVNSNGVEMSKQQYDSVIKYINRDILDNLTESECKYVLNNLGTDLVQTRTIYIESFVTDSGEIMSERQVDAATAISETKKIQKTKTSDTRNDSIQTEMKKITLTLVNVGENNANVVINCKWLSLPKCKSYDLIGVRFARAVKLKDTDNLDNIVGKQIYDGKTIKYNHNSDNFKKSSTGVGLSVNIPDDVSSSLAITLSVKYEYTGVGTTVAGSYQHATKNLSLSKSQMYDFAFNGMGGVFLFKHGVEDYYDNTKGLSVIGIPG